MDPTSNKNERLNKTIKIIGFYILGISCLGLFFYIDNSKELNDFLKETDNTRADWAFGFYASIGLIKMVSLIIGITIPLLLTFILIRQKTKRND